MPLPHAPRLAPLLFVAAGLLSATLVYYAGFAGPDGFYEAVPGYGFLAAGLTYCLNLLIAARVTGIRVRPLRAALYLAIHTALLLGFLMATIWSLYFAVYVGAGALLLGTWLACVLPGALVHPVRWAAGQSFVLACVTVLLSIAWIKAHSAIHTEGEDSMIDWQHTSALFFFVWQSLVGSEVLRGMRKAMATPEDLPETSARIRDDKISNHGNAHPQEI